MRLGVEAAIVEGELLRGDIEVADGKIVSVGLAPKRGGGIAVPGFVDLQVNGYAGVDFAAADAAGYATAGEALLEGGVTAYQPTLITAPEDSLLAALREVPLGEQAGPRILGVHLEGPFLSPARLGAHPAAARRDPDRELLERLLAAGPVSHMTLAPELPGALELVDLLHARGIVVSCGHTDATAAEAHAAFDRGVGTVTHLFNAMRPLGHRDPGIAGAALVRDDVIVQVILDGHHLARETAQLVWRTAAGRVALVTDAIAAAGTDATTHAPERHRRRDPRRHRAARRRRSRRQRRDDDRVRAESARARRLSGGCDRRRHLRARPAPRAGRGSACSSPAARRTSSCSTTGWRSGPCSGPVWSGWRRRWPRSCSSASRRSSAAA